MNFKLGLFVMLISAIFCSSFVFAGMDLNAISVGLNTYSSVVGDTVDINFIYINSGDVNATDFNVVCGVPAGPTFVIFSDSNHQSLVAGDSNYFEFEQLAQFAGSFDINCYLVSNAEPEDDNSNNSVLANTLTVYYDADLNVSSLAFEDLTPVYGGDVNIDFSITNQGSHVGYDSNDVNMYVWIIEDANNDNNFLLQSYTDQNFIKSNTVDYVVTWEDINIDGNITVYVVLEPSVEELDESNNSSESSATVGHVDLVADDISATNYLVSVGETIDINFIYSNIGTADATDFNISCGFDNGDPEPMSLIITPLGPYENISLGAGDTNYLVFSSMVMPGDAAGMEIDINCYLVSNVETDINTLNDSILDAENVVIYSAVDLEAYSLTFDNENALYGTDTNVLFTLSYENTGATNIADYNYYILYYIDGVLDANNEIDADLAFGSSDTNGYTWVFDGNVGEYDINVCLDYQSDDYNLQNNCVMETLTIYYRDLNVESLTFDDLTPIYGENVDFDLNITNNGNYDSNDVNVYVWVIDDTDNNYLLYSDLDTNFLLETTTTYTITWLDINMVGDINMYVELESSEADYNDLDNNSLFASVATVGYIDLNIATSMDTNVYVGDTFDVNATITNAGTAATDENYTVYLFVDGVEKDSNTLSTSLAADANIVVYLSWVPTASTSYDINVYVEYAGADYNTLNDYNTATLDVNTLTDVDLTPTDLTVNSTVLGTTSTVTVDINNISVDTNATEDYNVLFYVDDVLTDFELVDTNIDANGQTSIDFSWVPTTAGTYSLTFTVDYTIADANWDNNSYSESVTITAPASGSGGSHVYITNPETTTTVTVAEPVVLPLVDNHPALEILLQGESKRVTVNGEEHTVTVDEVTEAGATITIASTPITYILKTGQSVRVDFEKDGVYDLKVTLGSIDDLGAHLFLEQISDPVVAATTVSSQGTTAEQVTTDETATPDTTTSVDDWAGDLTPETTDYTYAWWVLGIIVVLGIIYAIYAYSKK